MRKLAIAMSVVVLLTACGGGDDSTGTGDDEGLAAANSDGLDPCTLANDEVLAAYFGETTPEVERNQAGPIVSCTWQDANANSLTIQTATDYAIYRPDSCEDCVDISFGDDGYASEHFIQSTAKVIDGSLWLSVATTGFRDDNASITELLKTIYEDATS